MARKSAAKKRQQQEAQHEQVKAVQAKRRVEEEEDEEDASNDEDLNESNASAIAAAAADDEEMSQSGDDSEELGEGAEDSEDEVSDDEEAQAHSGKKKSGKKNTRNALPTLQEQNYLRETNTLFRSNLLRLQMDQLLEETRVVATPERAEKERAYLFALKDALMKIKHKGVITRAKAEVPLENWESTKDTELEFMPLEAVDVVGSYLLGTMVKPGRTVDLSVRMPSASFKQKDYLNHRYFDKRRMYLSVLASKLSKSKLVAEVRFAPFMSDVDKPVLLITPAADAGVGKLSVRVTPYIGDDLFPASRFQLVQNNVRPLNHFAKNATAVQDGGLALPPTPHHNMRLLEDVESSGARTHLEMLHELHEISPSFGTVSCLLKVWARVRGFSTSDGPDNFGEFLLTALLAQQILEKQISPMLSVQQLFRNFMGTLATIDLSKGPVARLRRSVDSELEISEGYSDEDFRKSFDVVLVGPCGRLNLAWRVSKSSWDAVAEQASVTHRLLEGIEGQAGGRSSFEAIFSAPMDLWHQFDKYYSIPFPAKLPETWEAADLTRAEQALLCDLGWEGFVRRRVEDSFRRAFLNTKRASVVRIRVNSKESSAWAPNEEPKRSAILVCMLLNREEAFRVIDKGPSAEQATQAAAFRAFWGKKSELRRFRDGSILETLDWRPAEERSSKRPASGTHSAGDSYDVCDTIASYVADHRWPLQQGGKVIVVGRELELMLGTLDRQDRQRARQLVIPSEPYAEVRGCADELMKRLRALQLPLSVIGFRPADPTLRYASITRPGRHPLAFGSQESEGAAVLSALMSGKSTDGSKKRKMDSSSKSSVSRLVDVIELIVDLESSGQWPDDVEAIRVMKTAFYVQIAEQLEASYPGQQRCVAATSCLDVLTGGYAFRLRIKLDKERQILRSPRVSFHGSVSSVAARRLRAERSAATGQSDETGLVKDGNKPTQLALDQADELERETVLKPHLHGMLHSVHGRGDEFGGANVMGPVSRLAKLWVSGHLFWPHITEEAIELIVASIFLHPQPYKAPRSLASGFVRFLQLLCSWDWNFEPLLVDLREDTGDADLRTSLMKSFNSMRERASGAHMFIVTSEDVDSSGEWKPRWTSRQQPSKDSLSRMVKVARDSLVLLEQLFALQASGKYQASKMQRLWSAVFQSTVSPKEFDVVVQLNAVSSLRESKLPVHARAKLYKNTAAQEKLLLGCNPIVSYATDLQKELGHLFSVHYDPFRGSAIGLKWNEGLLTPVALRVASSSHAKPAEESDNKKEINVVPNITDILVDVAELGEGLVDSISCSSVDSE